MSIGIFLMLSILISFCAMMFVALVINNQGPGFLRGDIKDHYLESIIYRRLVSIASLAAGLYLLAYIYTHFRSKDISDPITCLLNGSMAFVCIETGIYMLFKSIKK